MKKFVLTAMLMAIPSAASAEVFEVWARADGGYMGGDADLHYFQVNDIGPEYGFAVGAHLLFLDVFANVNFHPDGSMFNLIGLSSELDLLPIDALSLGPIGQTAYFFAPTGVAGEFDDRGLIFRGGAFFEINFSPFVSLGAEGLTGYALITSDADAGLIWSGSGYLKISLGL